MATLIPDEKFLVFILLGNGFEKQQTIVWDLLCYLQLMKP